MNKQSKISENCYAKPFLKWAGGKKRLLPELLKYVPTEYNNYYEPFLGGGSLFFALRPKKAYLSDLNEELINTYEQIKVDVDEVIKYLKKMKYDKKAYYRIRGMSLRNNSRRAARFIYLNRACWNGLYRVNPRGKFNVPFGRYENPTICNEENLKNVGKVLKKAVIKNCDFGKIVHKASKDDLIYFDPPYTTAYRNNGFIKYNSKLFSLKDQIRLRNAVRELDKKGCNILISNANHKFIENLYKGYSIKIMKRKSLIAGKKEKRREITELIIRNFNK